MSDKFFDNLTKEFTTVAEYKDFAEAQNKTILELGKKIRNLELKLKNPVKETKELICTDPHISPEELICLTQLKVLNEYSNDRELTLEEAKKVDIYTRILSQIRSKKKDDDLGDLSNIPAEDLLKIVENESK